MAIYLLTWNPRNFNRTTLVRDARDIKRYHRLQGSWSCGNTKKIDRGDRFFMIRLGAEPRGIFASGVVASSPYRDGHWNRESGKTANFVDVIWDTLLVLGGEPILPMTYLKRAFDGMHCEPQASGVRIPDDIATRLEKAWVKLIGHRGVPAVPPDPKALEGLKTETTHYVRGRSRYLRDLALDRAQGVCSACLVNFSQVLGGDGTRVLQVHHRRQLGATEVPRVTTLRGLAVVCANCHMLIHMNPRRAIRVETLRARIAQEGRVVRKA